MAKTKLIRTITPLMENYLTECKKTGQFSSELDPAIFKLILSHIDRVLWVRSPSRNQAFANARVKHGQYMCACCAGLFSRNEVECDHKLRRRPNRGELLDIVEYCKRTFVPASALAILCKSCHKDKSYFETVGF